MHARLRVRDFGRIRCGVSTKNCLGYGMSIVLYHRLSAIFSERRRQKFKQFVGKVQPVEAVEPSESMLNIDQNMLCLQICYGMNAACLAYNFNFDTKTCHFYNRVMLETLIPATSPLTVYGYAMYF